MVKVALVMAPALLSVTVTLLVERQGTVKLTFNWSAERLLMFSPAVNYDRKSLEETQEAVRKWGEN